MNETISTVKKHWPIVVGGLVGLLVLYFIYKKFASPVAPAQSTTPDLSGGASSTTNYDAAASLQNAQLNSQTEIASYSANVADNQTAAALAASLANTSATEAVSLAGQQAQVQENSTDVSGAVQTQQLISQAAVDNTQIEGDTLTSIAGIEGQTAVSVEQAKTAVASQQLDLESKYLDVLASKGKLGGGSTGVSQIASTILSGGQTGPGVISANQPSNVAEAPGATISAVSSGIGSVLSGLFG